MGIKNRAYNVSIYTLYFSPFIFFLNAPSRSRTEFKPCEGIRLIRPWLLPVELMALSVDYIRYDADNEIRTRMVYNRQFLRLMRLPFRHICIAGHTGFEPVNVWIKIICLSTWRMPNNVYIQLFSFLEICGNALNHLTIRFVLCTIQVSVTRLQILYEFVYVAKIRPLIIGAPTPLVMMWTDFLFFLQE